MKIFFISNYIGIFFFKKLFCFLVKYKLFNGIVDMFLVFEDKFLVVMIDNVISD